jgi:hypothetical protein
MEWTAFFIALGVTGSVASIIALLIAAPGLKSKFVHLGYAIFITALASGVVEYQHRVSVAQRQLEELRKVEREARQIVGTANRATSGSMQGFMLATLSFLEKHKDRFPDTYARALKLCEDSGCMKSGYSDNSGAYLHFLSMQEGSSAMEYLLRGIAASGDEAR